MKTDIANAFNFLHDHLDDLSSTIVPLWHPLGFVSCVINDSSKEQVVRVHYWPAGERRVKNPDWPIHTHSYFLKSLVLSGRVKDLQYSVERGEQWCVYSVNYYEGGSEIIRTSESINAHPTIDEIRDAGVKYEVPRGVFHQTKVPDDQTAVTLALLTDHGTEPPKVLGTKQGKKYPYDRIEYDPEVFWKVVREAVECHLTNRCK
ncbi:hypothetical protein CWI75_04660 [Kineobactrum sediminis]|uniref:Uncharacterized protein n=1 Tax=Kineobactrum sediminis TaxID=1905677 RepID=A0A2N5Y5H5_9GAMM|nr:hypothetical protein [Kineobactrum sediminis]PLW83645.1 hypothetical protein CWI75_04660 [Kineobactrum sediminis]